MKRRKVEKTERKKGGRTEARKEEKGEKKKREKRRKGEKEEGHDSRSGCTFVAATDPWSSIYGVQHPV